MTLTSELVLSRVVAAVAPSKREVVKAALTALLQKSKRLEVALDLQMMAEADANRKGMTADERHSWQEALTIANRRVDHDAYMLDSALNEVVELLTEDN